ncbi:hypothetical protein TRAPUB_3709 [Trametes pubescens]|uniref:Fungal-type protein kinase domain-containing protein n=1 Tax=Trametes pubescens TaxID=154538 RepID=A0A1M2VCW7_TRAPU|nr:hypothetical protein TRAPUB_3709 [Trametes pubescens]
MSDVVNSATPLRRINTTNIFSASQKPGITTLRRELRHSSKPKMVKVPYDRIMKYLPPTAGEPDPSQLQGIFNKVNTSTLEADRYQPLADALNTFATKFGVAPTDELAPNTPNADAHPQDGKFVIVATDSLSDSTDPTGRKVDLGMYPSGSKPVSEKRTYWSEIELSIEVKKEDKLDPFTSDSLLAQGFLGQIMTYTDLVFKRQQRTHYYTLAIFGKYASIARWDRSGYVFTEKFDYTTEPQKLALFVWRLSHASPAVRGHDHTATRIVDAVSAEYKLLNSYTETATEDSAKPAGADTAQASAGKTARSAAGAAAGDSAKPTPIDYARELFVNSLRNPTKWPWWKLTIPNVDPTKPPHVYLVGEPTFYAPDIVGRGTRGYVALDYTDPTNPGPFVYLKDCWRVVHPRSEQEGAILTYLNSKNVRYIPTMLCHGDVGEEMEMARDVWKEVHRTEKDCPLKNHRHYRLVVKEVGKPLKMFKNGRQLVWVIVNALISHMDAYTLANTIHRDISVGNILIMPDSSPENKRFECYGLLTDWELSKRTDATDMEPRHPDRTGTWQFMSINAMCTPTKEIDIPDELESLFHVLLYCSIRYMPHNCPNVGDFMYRYFDDGVAVVNKPNEYTAGFLKRIVFTSGELVTPDNVPIVFLRAPRPAPPSPPAILPPPSAATPSDASPSVTSSRPSTPTRSSQAPPKDLCAPPEVEIPEGDRHPIDRILKTLLPMFKALYEHQNRTRSGIGLDSGLNLNTSMEEISAPELGPRGAVGLFRKGSLGRPQQRSQDAAALKALEEQAEKLKDHAEMGELLVAAACSVDKDFWPEEDKQADQLAADFVPHKTAKEKENTQKAKASKRSAVDTTEEREHKKHRSTVSQT